MATSLDYRQRIACWTTEGRTKDEAGEKVVDPGHEGSLRDDHGHVSLEHLHHRLQTGGISHQIRRRFPLATGILQVPVTRVRINQSPPFRLKCGLGDMAPVLAEDGPTLEVPPLSDCCQIAGTRGGGEDRGDVVAEETDEDHDGKNREQDPISQLRIEEQVLLQRHAPVS